MVPSSFLPPDLYMPAIPDMLISFLIQRYFCRARFFNFCRFGKKQEAHVLRVMQKPLLEASLHLTPVYLHVRNVPPLLFLYSNVLDICNKKSRLPGFLFQDSGPTIAFNLWECCSQTLAP